MASQSITAYPELEAELGKQLREAAIDYDSFRRRLRVCELSTCRATCCHDGVYLTVEELRGIGEALGGAKGSESWLDDDGARPKSRTVEADTLPIGYPSHFPKTRCVFLDSAHRCALQSLAVERGKHPWFWKPVSCWMHPLVLMPGSRGERPCLTLPAPGSDPAERPGYPGFASCTPCGQEQAEGVPAWEALGMELNLLGRLADRDLIAEIRAACT